MAKAKAPAKAKAGAQETAKPGAPTKPVAATSKSTTKTTTTAAKSVAAPAKPAVPSAPMTKARAKELTRNDGWADDMIFEALESPEAGAYNEASRQLVATLEALDPDAAVERARELCDAALRHPSADARTRIGAACLPVLIKFGSLPAAYQPLASISGPIDDVRLVFEALPLEQRLQMLRTNLANPAPSPERVVELLDLAPAATTDVLELYERQQRPQWALLKDPDLDAQAERSPEIATILNAFRDGIRSTPQPAPATSGPFAFSDPKTIAITDVGTLDGLGLGQWRAAAGAYVGVDVKTTAQFIAKLEKDGKAASDADMRRWKVLRGGEHVYDVWIVGVDNGSVFPAGQKVSAGVHVVKSSWQSIDKKPASEQLARELAASEPASLWDPAKTKPS